MQVNHGGREAFVAHEYLNLTQIIACFKEVSGKAVTQGMDPRAFVEAGYDLRKIQILMGHRSLTTTMIYLHVSRETLSKIKSPLDLFELERAARNEGEVDDETDN